MQPMRKKKWKISLKHLENFKFTSGVQNRPDAH
jgi:hypothetical protein